MAKFTIKVTATLNGKPCKNPKVEFLQGESFLYPCKIKNGEIEFEIKPGINPNVCIEGYIKCDDECLNCPPQYFKKCLCNDVTLLEACQKCVDGFIVDTCTPAQIAAGLICTTDGCKCPPSTPLTDPNTGQCVQCITGTKDGCKICVAGHWEDIVCPTGERCENGVCNCPAGYIRDTFTGACIVKPECTDDSACGPCEICVSGNCEPVVCPDKHKCVNGECIYWPCTDTSCNNGADCGEECGCLDGVCTPCYMLNCAENTSCTSALGCECKGNDVCGPVGNCGGYCDGTTPCADINCTCYENRCVNCKNFPCDPGDCDGRANCGCTGGDCGGGFGCADNLELIKKTDCDKESGCELVAEYTSTTKCNCENIDFRVKNTNLQCDELISDETASSGGTVPPILRLKTLLYKGLIPYADYLNQIKIGDDELIQGEIATTINHYVLNNAGKEVLVFPPNVESLPNISIVDNKVADIVISRKHAKSTFRFTETIAGVITTKTLSTIVRIELKAVSIAIPNNDCVEYDEKIIAKYELDYTDKLNFCNKIKNVYTVDQESFVSDTVSTRRPLFVWSKSNTGTYAPTKYTTTDGVYDKNGWFRKEYGVKFNGKWIDKINSPKEQNNNSTNSNLPHELWANYNYRVQVDCGCKVNTAFHNKLNFCCPTDFNVEFNSCNTEVKIPAFNVCAVNGDLNKSETGTYKIPDESQVRYKVTISTEGRGIVTYDLPYTSTNRIAEFIKTTTEPITLIRVSQFYIGGLLDGEQCFFEKSPEEVELPNVVAERDCDAQRDKVLVTIPQTKGADLRIQTIIFESGTGDTKTSLAVVPSFNVATGLFTALLPKAIGRQSVFPLKAKLTFVGGCIKFIDITPCNASLILTPQGRPISLKACGGSGVTLQAIPEFFNTNENITYEITGGDLTAPITVTNQTGSAIFANLGAGEYTATAVQGTTNAQDTETIASAVVPTMTITPENLCGNSTSTLVVTGVPGSRFNFSAPAAATGAPNTFTLNAAGTFTFTIPSTGAGVYTAILTADATGSSCTPTTLTKTVATGGVPVSPTIVLEGQVCIGNPLRFRINDGGANQTYTLTASGGILTDSTLQATSGTFNGTFTPTLVNGSISIVSTTNACNTLTPSAIAVTSLDGPMITAGSGFCAADSPTITATVTVTGTPTLVTINGVTATNLGGGTYQVTGLSKTLTTVDAIASNATCTDTYTISLPSCNDCAAGAVTIESNSPTCGEQNTEVFYTSGTIGYLPGSTYQWYEVIGGIDSVISGQGGTITTLIGVLPLPVYSTIQEKFYKLIITKPNGCPYTSNTASVVAGNSITPIISGQTSVDTSSSNTYTGTPVISGATYVWTLSNTLVTNQVVGTNSSTLPITMSVPGTNILTLTVTDAGGTCSGTTSLQITATANCTQTVAISTQTTPCDNLSAIIGTGSSGSTISSWIWSGAGLTNQSGTGTVNAFNASVVPSGATIDITLTVTFSDGCIKTATRSYTRCSCLCSNNICQTSIATVGISGSIATYTTPVNMTSDIYVWFQIGGLPDRLKITRASDSTVILDTLQIGSALRQVHFTPGPGQTSLAYTSVPLNTTSVGGDIFALQVNQALVSCTVIASTSDVISPYKDPSTSIQAQRSANYGTNNLEVGIYIKIPAADYNGSALLFEGIPFNAEACATNDTTPNAASYIISCAPISAAAVGTTIV